LITSAGSSLSKSNPFYFLNMAQQNIHDDSIDWFF
jgi:hypothetical protein